MENKHEAVWGGEGRPNVQDKYKNNKPSEQNVQLRLHAVFLGFKGFQSYFLKLKTDIL